MYRAVTICASMLTVCAIAPRPADAAICGESPHTLILLDRSASMNIKINTQSRWDAAVNAVNTLTASFAGRLDFGLMLFPGTSSYCAAGDVGVPCGDNTAAAIASAMQSTYPQGNTPIGDTLDAAKVYFQGLGATKPRYAIVITDGEETCSGDPPAVAAALLAAGVKTYAVGFGSGVDPADLTDLAVAGGTTTYYQADNLTQLDAALQKIAALLSCCGNGVIDAGELCDVTIPFGQAGFCPTAGSCADGKACTMDILAGTACSARCVFSPITSAIDGDGCCLPGDTSVTDSDCPASCGDGVLDPGEQCDTAITGGIGGCPTACDDANDCTVDMLVGSGCDARCTATPITAPKSGDGCCPLGADNASDSDCPVACGNGVLEPGEACDTAIPAGATGACPTACDDNNACTVDVLRVADCETSCSHKPINAPYHGDGCCPQGANSLTDDDCQVVCGNGALEQGELCDTGIAQGQPGACPSACDDGDPCTDDAIAGSDCTTECATTAVAPKKLVADGCCPAGLSSRDDVDCPPPCNPDLSEGCVDLCAGVECPDGEYCNMGTCEAWPDPAASGASEGQQPGNDGAGQDAGGQDPAGQQDDDPGAGAAAVGDEAGAFDSSGCGCAARGATPADALPFGLLLGCALLLARRRRR